MKKVVLTFVHKDSYLINVQIQQFLHNSPDTDIFIHLDKKSESLKNEIIHHERVFFIKNNISITWGDDTMMKALFNSWNEIIMTGIEYEYFIMCTGQDLMVKSGLDEYLSLNKGKIWLDTKIDDSFGRMLVTRNFPRIFCRDLSKYPAYSPIRILRSLYFRLIRFNLIPKRKMSFNVENIVFYCSYNWSVIPYNVIKDLYEYVENTPGYKEMYQNTFVPEDRFLGTLIMNSKYSKCVVWNRADPWSKTMTYHTPIKVHPKIFTIGDIEQIDNSNCFFARKFDSKVDIEIINHYRSKILN